MNLQIFFEFREMLGMSRINHCRRCHPKEVGRFHSRITHIGHRQLTEQKTRPMAGCSLPGATNLGFRGIMPLYGIPLHLSSQI